MNRLPAPTFLALALWLHAGCTPEYYNRPLERYEARGSYDFDALEPGPDNSDSLFVCLTFSGGGTRAAALAYGVLQELADTPLGTSADGASRSLLDEADVISAVSGGSFTAMAYGLWGKELFYLTDGGLVNNLGLTYVVQSLRNGPIRQRIEQGKIDRFVLIIVDAGTESQAKFERSQRMPGKLRTSAQTATSGIYSNTLVMTLMTQYALLVAEPETQLAYERCRETIGQYCPDVPAPTTPPEAQVDNYVIDVNFYNLPDTETQERFLSLPTRFVLGEQDLQDLVNAGRSLVREHPEHQRLLADLGRAADP